MNIIKKAMGERAKEAMGGPVPRWLTFAALAFAGQQMNATHQLTRANSNSIIEIKAENVYRAELILKIHEVNKDLDRRLRSVEERRP